jgi:hypothetical protein
VSYPKNIVINDLVIPDGLIEALVEDRVILRGDIVQAMVERDLLENIPMDYKGLDYYTYSPLLEEIWREGK